MPTPNTQPIFSIAGDAQWTTLMTANNATHVSGNTSYLVFTAGTNGSYVQKIRFRHFAIVTNTSNANATVARVWINNGSVNTTATNNHLARTVEAAFARECFHKGTSRTQLTSVERQLPSGGSHLRSLTWRLWLFSTVDAITCLMVLCASSLWSSADPCADAFSRFAARSFAGPKS